MKRRLPTIRKGEVTLAAISLPPLTDDANRHEPRNALLALRQRIQVSANGQPIYFPWIPYQDTLRTFQSYLVKMPQEAINLFPQLRAMVDQKRLNHRGGFWHHRPSRPKRP